MIIGMIAGILILSAVICLLRIQKNKREERTVEEETFSWEERLWDMHTHILPCVDDGADSMEMALEMILREMKDGVTDIMLTPHYKTGETNSQEIRQKYLELVNEVNKRGYAVSLYLGNELFYDSDTVKALQDGRALTLGGTSYVLVEFGTAISYQNMKEAFAELQMAGYRPILAHFDRFDCLRHKKDRVEELVRQGVLMQVNANSFIKSSTEEFVTELAEEGMVHLVGTDCHSMTWRAPNMKNPLLYLSSQLEKELLLEMFTNHPFKVLNNKFI